MTAAQPRTVCVAPAWNEAGRVGAAVAAVPRDRVESVVLVDDASTDSTASEAAAAGATVLRHERRRGVGAAIRTGFRHALERGYDVVVVISGAGKTPAEQVPRLLDELARQNADFVQGSRYLPGGEQSGMPVGRRLGTRCYSLLFSLLAGHRVTDGSSGFRAISTNLLQDPRIRIDQPWLDSYELEPYLLFQSLRLGYRVVEVPVRIAYPQPTRNRSYTKMRPIISWWRIFRPLLFLRLGLRQ